MQKWYLIVNSLNSAEIFIYDYVGPDEGQVSAKDFIQELRNLESQFTTINIRINSGGGSVMEGAAIFNAIKQSPCMINGYIDGLAASMAGIIAMACKKVFMASNAQLMLHAPQNVAIGTASDFRMVADQLEATRKQLADVYAAKTGKTSEEIMNTWMKDGTETWFTPQQALTAKLVDEIYDATTINMPQNTIGLERMVAQYKPELENTFLTKPNSSMKKVIAALNAGKLVNLAEASTEELVAEAATTLINQLSARTQKIAELETQISTLRTEVENAKKSVLTDKSIALVDAAVSAKKILATQKETFVKLASASEDGYTSVKGVLDSLTPFTGVINNLKNPEASEGYKNLKDEFEKRSADGSLQTLKTENFEHFKAVYKAGIGKEFKES